MPTEKRRVQLTLLSEGPIRSLGHDPATIGSTEVWCALVRFAALVDYAGRELETRLTPQEWCLLADTLNGCADLWDYGDTPFRALTLVQTEVEDAIGLSQLDRKWLADDPATATELGRALRAKLAALTPVHGEAILAAVRHFWRDPTATVESQWWRVAARCQSQSESD